MMAFPPGGTTMSRWRQDGSSERRAGPAAPCGRLPLPGRGTAGVSGGRPGRRRGHRRGGHDRRRGGRDRGGPDHAGPYGAVVARAGIKTNPFDLGSAPGRALPSLGTLLGAALTTAPLAFRRIYPITSFCVIMVAVIATSGHTTSITFAAVIFAAYSAVTYSPFRRAALLSVLAAAFIVTAAYPNTSPPVPERFGALLVLLPTVAVGVAIRVWRRRARESAERLRLAQAGHEAETRRAVERERARIASEMHDVVTHNVSVMVVQAGAARRVLDSSPGDAREALLAVEASGRTAMTELRHLLGLLAPSGEAEPGAGEAAGEERRGREARGSGVGGGG